MVVVKGSKDSKCQNHPSGQIPIHLKGVGVQIVKPQFWLESISWMPIHSIHRIQLIHKTRHHRTTNTFHEQYEKNELNWPIDVGNFCKLKHPDKLRFWSALNQSIDASISCKLEQLFKSRFYNVNNNYCNLQQTFKSRFLECTQLGFNHYIRSPTCCLNTTILFLKFS